MADEQSFAEGVMQFIEILAPMKEAVMGYRTDLITQGIGADIADTMAADLHRLMTEQMIGVIKNAAAMNRGTE